MFEAGDDGGERGDAGRRQRAAEQGIDEGGLASFEKAEDDEVDPVLFDFLPEGLQVGEEGVVGQAFGKLPEGFEGICGS